MHASLLLRAAKMLAEDRIASLCTSGQRDVFLESPSDVDVHLALLML
jgi:hypothetical protein